MSTHRDRFEKLWDKFFARLKGKILAQADKQELTYPLMKLILADAKSDWMSEYDEGGRWLRDYMNENPAKGRLVYDILTDNISFSEVQKKSDSTGVVGLVAPLAGAALGFGVSSIFNAGVVVKIISAVVPAGLLFGTTKAMEPKLRHKRKQEQIDAYLSQLDKYKFSVISILSD